jgi:tetraacyldisaccharide-1-P 4'-kinase
MQRSALLPLAALYGAVMSLRNRAFDRGILSPSRVHVPVIAVGNLTAGGTGKTPLVEFLVGYLLRLGKRVAVVSRGYGRSSRGVVTVSDGKGAIVDARTGGDEAVQVARNFRMPLSSSVNGASTPRGGLWTISRLMSSSWTTRISTGGSIAS